MHYRHSLLMLLALIVLSAATVGAQAADPDKAARNVKLGWASGGARGPITGPAARALRYGPLPSDPVMLAERKALAAAEAGQAVPEPLAATPQPTILLGKTGTFDVDLTPSDSTGTIGTKRYIETINSKVAIYNVADLTLINADTLADFWSEAGSDAFDPQVMWDATTGRFYYTGDVVFGTSDNRLAFGFSKTDSPNNAVADWCHYEIGYGADFPDYPKLGDSKDFAIIGVNVFNTSDAFVGSDILAISKPPAGTTCPAPASLTLTTASGITVGGSLAFTPVPANEIDSVGTGWVVTRSFGLPAKKIGLFKVIKDPAASGAIISATGSAVTVPNYDLPANAPQKDTTFVLDTSDARMTQAVAAVDPGHGNKLGLWTQHSVKGGAGSMVRWYEIDPVGKVLLQNGNVQNGTLYYFNAAISPDRVVRGATKAFGSNMLLNFNASASTAYPSIRMVAKRGTDTVSAVKVVKSSPGPDIDFSCGAASPCRWGDYAAASPDPNAPTAGSAGIVWGTGMWTLDGRISGSGTTSWRTWNWKSQP